MELFAAVLGWVALPATLEAAVCAAGWDELDEEDGGGEGEGVEAGGGAGVVGLVAFSASFAYPALTICCHNCLQHCSASAAELHSSWSTNNEEMEEENALDVSAESSSVETMTDTK